MNIVKLDESNFEELMTLMNTSFGFGKPEDLFEHILPKYYFKENTHMIHYGIRDEGILKTSIGLYPDTLLYEERPLSVAYIGGVSTHPDARKKGYFTTLLEHVIKEASKMGIALLILDGNRYRYRHFGFEYAGQELVLSISQRTKETLSPKTYSISPMDPSDKATLQTCLELYRALPLHMERTPEDFYSRLLSWNGLPYVVMCDNQVVGYFSKKGSCVQECVWQESYLDTVFCAALGEDHHVELLLPGFMESKNLRQISDHYEIRNSNMYKILDPAALAQTLSIPQKNPWFQLDSEEQLLKAFGSSGEKPSFAKLPFYILPCDRG